MVSTLSPCFRHSQGSRFKFFPCLPNLSDAQPEDLQRDIERFQQRKRGEAACGRGWGVGDSR